MKMTKKDKQMVEAAKFIKKCCKGYDCCEGCPFNAVEPCCLLGVPSTWYIPEVSENEKC